MWPTLTKLALRNDGALEPSFQTGGILSANLSAGVDECRDLVTDGTRLIATGRVNGNIAVFSVDLVGSTTISPTSSTVTGFPRAIVRSSDGGLVVAGFAVAGGVLLRYLPSLASDVSFGLDGLVISAGDTFNDVVIDPRGRYVAVGKRSGTSAFVARFMPNGSLDPSFGTNGLFVLSDRPGELYSVIIDKMGRIVAVGTTNDASGSHMLVLRLY